MKKLIIVLLVLLLVASLSACTQKNPVPEEKPEVVRATTMGQALVGENIMFEYDENLFRIVTEDMLYEAPLTKEVYDKLKAVDFFAEDRDEKFITILNDVKVEKAIAKEDLWLTEDQMKAYIGQKGQKLLDDGFEYSGSVLGEKEAMFMMEKDYCQYTITMEESFQPTEDFTEDSYIPQATIKKIEKGYNY